MMADKQDVSNVSAVVSDYFDINFRNIILNAIKDIRNKSHRPDNNSICDFVCKNFAANIDQEHIYKHIKVLVNNNAIINKPTARGNSYFIKEYSTNTDTEASINKGSIQVQLDHLRIESLELELGILKVENSNKNLIIKTLLENINRLTKNKKKTVQI